MRQAAAVSCTAAQHASGGKLPPRAVSPLIGHAGRLCRMAQVRCGTDAFMIRLSLL